MPSSDRRDNKSTTQEPTRASVLPDTKQAPAQGAEAPELSSGKLSSAGQAPAELRRSLGTSSVPNIQGQASGIVSAPLPGSTLFDALRRSDTPLTQPTPSEPFEDKFLRLPPEIQKRVLAGMSAEQAAEIEQKINFRMLEKAFGGETAQALLASGISSTDLTALTQMAARQGEARLKIQETGLKSHELLKTLKGPDFAGLQSMSNDTLAAAMGMMLPTEEAALDPKLIELIVARLATQPDKLVQVQQERFYRKNIESAERIAESSSKEAAKLSEQYKDAWLPEALSPTVAGLKLQQEGFVARSDAASRVAQHNTRVLEDSLAAAQAAGLLRALPAPETPSAKAQRGEIIAQLYSRASSALFERKVLEFDTKAGAAKIVEGDLHQSNASSRLNVLSNSMEVTRDGAVVVVAAGAAMIAAPVVFTAAAGAGVVVATGAAIAGSVATGAAVGAGLGGTISLLEQSGYEDLGNKTGEQAWNDLKADILKHGADGAKAGLGGGVGGLAAKGVAGLSVLQGLGQRGLSIASGMAAGGAGAATSTTASLTYDLISAREKFFSDPANKSLSHNVLAERYANHLKSQGLDFPTLCSRLGKDTAMGVVLGGLGAHFQSLREVKTAAGATLSNQALLEIEEVATATALGFGKVYLESPQDRRTFEQLVPLAVGETFQNITSVFQGRAARMQVTGESASPTAGAEVRNMAGRAETGPDLAALVDRANQVFQNTLGRGGSEAEAMQAQQDFLRASGYTSTTESNGNVKLKRVNDSYPISTPSVKKGVSGESVAVPARSNEFGVATDSAAQQSERQGDSDVTTAIRTKVASQRVNSEQEAGSPVALMDTPATQRALEPAAALQESQKVFEDTLASTKNRSEAFKAQLASLRSHGYEPTRSEGQLGITLRDGGWISLEQPRAPSRAPLDWQIQERNYIDGLAPQERLILRGQHAEDVHGGIRNDLEQIAASTREQIVSQDQRSITLPKPAEDKPQKTVVARTVERVADHENPRLVRGSRVSLDQVPVELQSKAFDPNTMEADLKRLTGELVDSYFPKPSQQQNFDYNGAMKQIAERTVELVSQAYRDGDLAPTVQAGDIYQLVHENIASAALQERAARETTLGDHGVRHVFDFNINQGLNLATALDSSGLPFSAIRQLEYVIAMTYHDIGYASGQMRDTIRVNQGLGFDKGHNVLGAKYVREQFEAGGSLAKVFTSDNVANIHEAILNHDKPGKGAAPDGSFERIEPDTAPEEQRRINRDNLAKLMRRIDPAHFEASKLPPVLQDADGIQTIYAMKEAASIYQGDELSAVLGQLRSKLKETIRSRELPIDEKDALGNAVDQLNADSWKFNMPRIAMNNPAISLEMRDGVPHTVYTIGRSSLSDKMTRLFVTPDKSELAPGLQATFQNKQLVKAVQELLQLEGGNKGEEQAKSIVTDLIQANGQEYVSNGVIIRVDNEPAKNPATPFQLDVAERFDGALRSEYTINANRLRGIIARLQGEPQKNQSEFVRTEILKLQSDRRQLFNGMFLE